MAEAEDVLTDVARHTTIFAQKLWQKYRAQDPVPHTVGLVDIAPRLDLLANSVFGRHYTFRVALPPARPTFLATVIRHNQSPFRKEPVPANDNSTIWLPANLQIADASAAREVYRLLALQQAMRMQRGSAIYYEKTENPLWADLYLLLEAHAADAELVKLLPGMKPPLLRLRERMLKQRPPVAQFSTARQSVEMFYLDLLSDIADRIPASPSAVDSLSAAEKMSKQLIGEEKSFSLRMWSNQPLLKDWWTGELRRYVPAREATDICVDEIDSDKKTRSAHLSRRPEERQATEDEDKPDKSAAWMVQGDESHPHAEDPFGLQRPIDRDDHTQADEFADLVSELAEARLVSTPGQPKEFLLSDDPPDARTRAKDKGVPGTVSSLTYPEWDYRKGAYQDPGATVLLIPVAQGSQEWVDQTLETHHVLLESIRRRFEILQSRRVLHRKQLDGEEIDIDAYISSRADFRAGGYFTEALYQTRRTSDRSLAVTLLIDISGSTDAWISENRRIIEVEREALLLVCKALESVGEPYSVLAFSGDGVNSVKIQPIKSFNERFDNEIALRISALEPERYTRVGAALRHATAQLMQTNAAHKLLLLLSDGKPNDNDMYEGRYGLEDTRQAVTEAKLQGIYPFCLTIDRQAAAYLPSIFGRHQYALLPKPELLPRILLEWMKRLLAH
jgi:nitric oxide reductase NorD protein